MADTKKPTGKKKLGSKALIKQEFANKRESMLREKELDSFLLRELLGLTPKGDMSDFVKGVIKKLKAGKKGRGFEPKRTT